MVSCLVIGGSAGCANKVVYEPLEMLSNYTGTHVVLYMAWACCESSD